MSEAHYLIVNAFGRSNRGDSVLLDQCIDQIRIADPSAKITGVVFEDVDVFGGRTEHGVGRLGSERHAWFKDSEGNVICIWQPESPRG